jgi:hypothetical protein
MTSTIGAPGPGTAPSPARPATTPLLSTTTTTRPAAIDATGPPGSFAPAYLRPSVTGAVLIEWTAAAGSGPQPGTLARLRDQLAGATGKPVSVGRSPVTPPGDPRAWTGADLVAVAEGAGTTRQSEAVAVLRLLFVNGTFGGDESVLGVAVRGDVAAIFTDRVAASATLLVRPQAIEDAVGLHEVGHLLGLVDLHLQTGRADPQHPGHSTNQASVMYWAVESSLVAELLTGGPPRDFDADDWADLRAIRDG